ncbi:Stk1 family PASTA domain-containing Ser/Thr kinase [Actinopolymorpha rutila]|uniref:non-specific serine/threonine protein kinase n=1 Tax=Actinopolymorpha rutila TaxID=446787 RepID=A0A852ZER1_9ACTN|nr:Stk1 family PASTA domain-containing Ser/Thr kinase [Actinopolymorpha rutila]NYH87450.1 serine/threonine-protein kinase [Actinopolymorpha rutila]
MTEARFLGGRYELGEVLGHGGMAEVRIGVDRRLGRTVAVKTLRPDLATDPIFQARFRREAQSAAALNQPTIVAVYDTGEEKADGISVPYIVMEYVEGRTLRDVLREGRRILPERALEITADVLEALEYSHRAGIIHRDIKPGNVMLTPSGDVKVMDFGIARAVADASATMTQTAAVIGTAQYLSPEQARGESVDARSDIYSTGCLLYELLTGRPPFVGDSPVSVAYQHVREEPRPASMLDPEVPPIADAITLKALQKKPHDRYQSAAEMRQDIERGLSGQELIAPMLAADATARFLPPDEPDTPTNHERAAAYAEDDEQNPQRGRRAAYILLAIAIVFVLGVAAFIGLQSLGKNSANTVSTPTLQGKTLTEAQAVLARSQLRLGKVTQQASKDVTKGQIVSQNPTPGASAKVDSAVDVAVSSGQGDVTIPAVVGKKVSAARAMLEKEGLNVVSREDSNASGDANSVSRVNPDEGSVVKAGSTVTLYHASGLVSVPRVVGDSVAVAEARLADAGFRVSKRYDTTSQAQAGTVVRQVPGAGQRREPDTTVTIVIARAPAGQPKPQPKPKPTKTKEPSPTPTPTPTQPEPTPTQTESPKPTPTDTPPPEPQPTPTTPAPQGDAAKTPPPPPPAA